MRLDSLNVGDSIEITDKGYVRTPHRNFKWKGEDAFIQSKTIYVPKAGDTLYFDKLNEVEQDYILAYLHTLFRTCTAEAKKSVSNRHSGRATAKSTLTA